MNLFISYVLFLLVFSMTLMSEVFAMGSGSMLVDPETLHKKCQYFREKSMLASSCRNLGIEEIPSTLRSDVEVLDLSVNRMADLKNNTLAKFTSLKYLDLSDNFLQTIEEGVFTPLQYLKSLDLTKTRLTNIPRSLFTLPNLERLFLENNKLTDSSLRTKVSSPLIVLYAAKNSLTKMPQLGILPTLLYLNLSENSISKIDVDDIVPFCKLMTLDISKNPIKFDPSTCDCQVFQAWIKQHNITVRPTINCNENSYCLPVKFSNRTIAVYQECEEMIRVKVEIEKARSTWILVASCVSGFLVCVILALYCVHRRNTKKRKKLKKAQQLASSNANTELLNGNLQEQS